jgi:hypothetical protein
VKNAMKQEGIMMRCGMEPITSIRHVERMSPLQEDQEAYCIRCRRCGRETHERFTDETWPEAKERAREKWNRGIMEEIKS